MGLAADVGGPGGPCAVLPAAGGTADPEADQEDGALAAVRRRHQHQQVFSTGDWYDYEEDAPGVFRKVYEMADDYLTANPYCWECRNMKEACVCGAQKAGVRRFDTGATRDSEDGKPDYEGFLSPLVLKRFAEYMHKHRVQSDGSLRDSDNWQKGIPLDAYMKSAWRHFVDWWREHRRRQVFGCDVTEEALCALLFNVQGYLHELLREREVAAMTAEQRRRIGEALKR